MEEWQTLYTVLNTMYHCCRQCNLEFSSPYSVSVSASNTVGSSPATAESARPRYGSRAPSPGMRGEAVVSLVWPDTRQVESRD